MKKTMILAALGLTLGIAPQAQALDRPFWPIGISLAAPLQLPFTNYDIYGLRFDGFFGWNATVYGVDCGVADLTTLDFAGLQAAGFTWTSGSAYGVQVAGIANVVGVYACGLQIAPVNVVHGDNVGFQVGCVNYEATYTGVQIGGALNWNTAEAYGLQIATANASQSEFQGCQIGAVDWAPKFTGCQIGAVNVAEEGTGVQIGVFNAVDRLHGVQIGVINLICESVLPAMVIMNASF